MTNGSWHSDDEIVNAKKRRSVGSGWRRVLNDEELEIVERLIYATLCLDPHEDPEGCEEAWKVANEFGESSAYDKLFDYFADEMPYGVLTGDDENPIDWIINRIKRP